MRALPRSRLCKGTGKVCFHNILRFELILTSFQISYRTGELITRENSISEGYRVMWLAVRLL